MTPNFALHLSVEGITLDQRGPKGWVTLGTVGFDTNDLTADLAALRAKGIAAAAPSDFLVKLVLPNDQIKELTLRDAAPTRTSVGMALEGATPYGLHELEFDWVSDDGSTFVVAVAKETLAEAETFARDNAFTPVSIVALPGNGWMGREAFLGALDGATDVVRDELPYTRSFEPIPIVVEDDGDAAPFEDVPLEDNNDEPASTEEAEDDASGNEAPVEPQNAQALEITSVETLSAQPTDVAEPSADVTPEPDTGSDPVQTTESEPQPGFASLRRRTEVPVSPPELQSLKVDAGITSDTGTAPRIDVQQNAAEGTAPKIQINADPAPSAPSITGRAASAMDEDAVRLDALRPQVAQDDVAFADEPERNDTMATLASGAASMFRSRRKAKPAAEKPVPAVDKDRADPFPLPDRRPRVGGKPRFLGLILTAILLILLLAIAAFATVSSDGLARFFDTSNDVPEVASVAPSAINLPDNELIADGAALEELTSLPAPNVNAEDRAETGPSDAEIKRIYAATGIWQRSPAAPRTPSSDTLASLYTASIDREIVTGDAVAISRLDADGRDHRPSTQSLPPAPDARFSFTPDGLLIATPEGTVAPQGYTVFAGKPETIPPVRIAPALEAEPEIVDLAAFRPRPRPDGFSEKAERDTLGGYSISELAKLRPQLRPQAPKVVEEEKQEEADTPPSQYAVATSKRPGPRPKNMARIVAKARESAPGTVKKVAAIAPTTTRPSGTTKATVARAATDTRAINLRRVNLIGVYGKPSSRTALVRLANGRFVRVRVGDRVDGGKVAAIGESQIRYVKGGRNITLDIPS